MQAAANSMLPHVIDLLKHVRGVDLTQEFSSECEHILHVLRKESW